LARGSFRQADIERIIRAARNAGAVVNVDIRTLVCTIVPLPKDQPLAVPTSYFKPDGKESWEDDEPWMDHGDEPLPPKVEPFDWREAAVMEHLGKLGVNVRAHWREIKNFGPGTQAKLLLRGYIGVTYDEKHPERRNEVWLTERGFKDLKAVKYHYMRYPSF